MFNIFTRIDKAFDLGPLVPEPPSLFPRVGEGIRNRPGKLPGVRCKVCAAKNQEVWVVPGLACAECGTPAPDEDGVDSHHHPSGDEDVQ